MNLIEHFINGKITKGSSKKTSKVFNPATGEQTAQVNLATKEDIDLAVEKAKKAFIDWSIKPPSVIPSPSMSTPLPVVLYE